MYFPCSENKGDDQLRGFRICRLFSHEAAHLVLCYCSASSMDLCHLIKQNQKEISISVSNTNKAKILYEIFTIT